MSTSTSPNEVDAELVRRFVAESDEAAFTEIVTKYRDYLFPIALNYVKTNCDAQEVVQDVFLRAYRKLRDFRGDCSLKTWLVTITVRVATNRYWYWMRRGWGRTVSTDVKAGDKGSFTLGDFIPSGEASPDRQVVTAEFATIIELALSRLSPNQRRILALRTVANLEYEEIATELGIEVGTVKSRLARSRASLMKRLRTDNPDMGENAAARDFLESIRVEDVGLKTA